MDEDAGWEFIDRHRIVVADVLAALTPEQWATPSLCEEWTVRDVGAHLSIAATTSVGEALGWLVRARGSYNGMIRDSARERAQRPTEQIVADLRGLVGVRRLAPSTAWRDPLIDLVVHAQDIAVPLSVRVAADLDAVRTCLDWARSFRFVHVAHGRLRGLRLVATDTDWTRGWGRELRGPAESLLMVSTGRPAGLRDLEGEGVDLARRRMRTVAAA